MTREEKFKAVFKEVALEYLHKETYARAELFCKSLKVALDDEKFLDSMCDIYNVNKE